ncbi:MAG TPA: hypothetical protein VMY34_06945 [Acidimicrobiales bacterium]|nr:hypothetical protein [Acidimicrobiales bacterium]
MDDRAVAGTPITGGTDRPSKAFKKGRVCVDDGCTTVLSMYNHGAYCSLHQPMAVPRTRGRKIA